VTSSNVVFEVTTPVKSVYCIW